ncbi:hypothetical protein cyc_02389 [Cyclospora cayetanensis]|uniref:Uncharacterized protein n=1 Tax=Cyclospora cayetanensis TaxID=88456 RepID=A0A1D3CZT5_9EIME|nr:hypothetical protein cyc_02389 [Cyclospora cayetanensis]
MGPTGSPRFFCRVKRTFRHERALNNGLTAPSLSRMVSAKYGLVEAPKRTPDHSPVSLNKASENDAAEEAFNTLDVFSPDAINTRGEDFMKLFTIIQEEYQKEKVRGDAIRGPNRAATIGTAIRRF